LLQRKMEARTTKEREDHTGGRKVRIRALEEAILSLRLDDGPGLPVMCPEWKGWYARRWLERMLSPARLPSLQDLCARVIGEYVSVDAFRLHEGAAAAMLHPNLRRCIDVLGLSRVELNEASRPFVDCGDNALSIARTGESDIVWFGRRVSAWMRFDSDGRVWARRWTEGPPEMNIQRSESVSRSVHCRRCHLVKPWQESDAHQKALVLRCVVRPGDPPSRIRTAACCACGVEGRLFYWVHPHSGN